MEFHYRNGELYAEDVNVRNVVEEFGTPVYIYSKKHFITQFKKLQQAFSKERKHTIAYAIKANSNINVVKVFSSLGAGADIVSQGELIRAMKSGINPRKIVFSGVGKTAEELEYALAHDIMMINVESEEELLLLNSVAINLGKKARIALRVNPNIDPKTHPYISTGLKKNKFGIPFEEAETLYKKAANMKGLEIKGIQFHIGSQLTDLTPIFDASRRIIELVKTLNSQGIPISVIDVGGGIGIKYSPSESEPDISKYAKALENTFPENVELVCEPGRYLTGNGGVLITKTLYHKTNGNKNFIIVDGAMNDLIRPALYHAFHEIKPVILRNKEKIICDIVGPVCETGDFFAKDYEIENPENGDLLCIFSAGAYGFTMASNYNSRRKPAEVMVSGKNYKLIRKRETYNNMFEGELL